MFLDALVLDALETATIDQMDVVITRRVVVIYGDPTAAVNAWDFSRNGENKFSTTTKLSRNFQFLSSCDFLEQIRLQILKSLYDLFMFIMN